MKILEILETNKIRHMSAEDVYKVLLEAQEDIGLATVYRVLNQFEASGLVIKHNFEGGHSVFELNRGGHHDHIVCVRCGRVEEFYDDTIEERQREIADKLGFVIEEHALTIYGRCSDPKCRGGKR